MLDDAAFNNDVSNGAVLTGTVLSWSGAVAVGLPQTITYSVTVGLPGDGQQRACTDVVVTPPNSGGNCDAGSTRDVACTTSTPVASFQTVKTTDATTFTPGATVDYIVAVTNTGASTTRRPPPRASPTTSPGCSTTRRSTTMRARERRMLQPTLSWSGALAVGETVDGQLFGDDQIAELGRPRF